MDKKGSFLYNLPKRFKTYDEFKTYDDFATCHFFLFLYFDMSMDNNRHDVWFSGVNLADSGSDEYFARLGKGHDASFKTLFRY